jgi:ribonuclease Z
MTEVLFLGIGAALPMPGQTNSSYLIRTHGANILIDCGPAILQQLAAVGVSPGEITHIYLTHRHGDHILGYPMLMLWWGIEAARTLKRPTVIASDITFESLDLLMQGVFGGEVAEKSVPGIRIVLPHAESHVQMTPEIKLQTLPMLHSEFAPDLGVRIEVDGKVLVFTGDTSPTNNVIELARDADLLVHDSTYSATLNPEFVAGVYGHSTAQISARHAAKANVKHLALVHIDAIYQSKQRVLLEEAQYHFKGRVSIPVAGTLYSF